MKMSWGTAEPCQCRDRVAKESQVAIVDSSNFENVGAMQ